MNETRGLWRGKCIDNSEHNGEWVEGFYFREIGDFIKEPPSSVSTKTYLVDPSTLGECTGLTDKNGKLIFEGDILKYYDDNSDLGLICFGNYGHYPNRDNHRGFYALRNTRKRPIFWDMPEFPVEKLECAEIIGNSFDNPELLKGENDVP